MNDQNTPHEDPFAQAADATAETAEQLEAKAADKAESFGEAAQKIATEASYAVAGFAGLVGEKAKAFYEEQKKQYADAHPEADKDPGAKQFLEQLSAHLSRLVEDLTKGYRDLAERGRDAAKRRTDEDVAAAETKGEDPADWPTQPEGDQHPTA